ncbi:odorant receptor 131-2-like [Hyla sarda]|uniref:odorant receptor 131-2-like n=1 Tax=Hyla sarda TaxID=327740 RepID=UPI0024C36C0C|nr:odorant receptor 131-2-like [Hyla sarda]
MVNSTELSNNATTQVITSARIVMITVLVLMVLFFVIFAYFMVIILNVFFTSPQVHETTRYILFIHMLFNDVIYLLISFFLFIVANYGILFPVAVCLVITSLSTGTFIITPYNLAVMSLERYAAICHPLRYAELCTAQRSNLVIAFIWIMGMIPQLANVIVYCCFADSRSFNFRIICDWKLMTVSNFQVVIRNFTDIVGFSTVTMTITYTYVKVMMVARRMDSGKFASKAGKTVLLHAFQLMLSMLSFTTVITETYLTKYIRYLPSINFLVMCLPRFVSPLIYGMRDEVFGKSMRKFHLLPFIRSLHLIRKNLIVDSQGDPAVPDCPDRFLTDQSNQ